MASASSQDPRRGGAFPVVLTLLGTALLAAWGLNASGQGGPPGPTTDASAVFAYDASGADFHDVTGPARSAAANDVPVGTAAGDLLYVGHADVFDQVKITIGRAGAQGTIVWEYYNGAQWAALLPSDATQHFRVTGDKVVSWNPPSGWSPLQLDAESAPGTFYFVRARITAPYTDEALLSRLGLEAWRDPAAAIRYEAERFTSIGRLHDGNLNDVAVQGTVAVAVGNDGVILRSTNGGDSWQKATSGVTAHLWGVALADATTGIAVGNGGKILRTTNAGVSWTVTDGQTTRNLLKVEFVTSSLVVVVGDLVILKSTNGGLQWSRQDRAGEHLAAVCFGTDATGWAMGDDGDDDVILRTVDAGESWADASLDSTLYPEVRYVKDCDAPTRDYAWIAGDGFRARTLDGGTTWDLFTGSGFFFKAIILGALDAGWSLGDNGFVERITKANATLRTDVTFTRQDQEPTLYVKGAFAASPANAWAVGDAGLILRTTASGVPWTQPNALPSEDVYGMDVLSDGTFWAAGAKGTLFRSADAGATWQRVPTGVSTDLRGVDFVHADVGWIVGIGGVLRKTADRGNTWTQQLGPTAGVPALYAIDMLDLSKGWAVGDLGDHFRTTNGQDWSKQATGTTQNLRDVAFVAGSTVVAVGTSGLILRSTSNGNANSWSSAPGGGSSDLHAVAFGSDRIGWAAGVGSSIRVTTEAGVAWTGQGFPASDMALRDVAARDVQTAWAVAEGGHIFKTNDGGGTWLELESPSTADLYTVSARPGTPPVLGGQRGALLRPLPAFIDATGSLRDATDATMRASGSLSRNDAVYIGQDDKFDSVAFRIDAPASGAVVAWEYWDGDSWDALGVVDGTGAFSQTGVRFLKFALPTGWATTAVEPRSDARLYYVRARFVEPPGNGFVRLAEASTLRLLTPVQVTTTTTTTTGAGTTTTTRPNEVPGFGVSAEPLFVDFGLVRREATANRTVSLVAWQGSGNATAYLDGPAGTWFTSSASDFELLTNQTQAIRLDLSVPSDARPGPTTARLFVRAVPSGTAETVVGFVQLNLSVEAADLVSVTFQPTPPTWTATFGNYLHEGVDVRFDATVQAAGSDPVTLATLEKTFPPQTTDSVESALDAAGLAPGPYELVVTAVFEGQTHTKRMTVYVGGPPVTVHDLTADVIGRERVEFEYEARNVLDVPVKATPRIDIEDRHGVVVATLTGPVLDLGAKETKHVNLTWPAQLGFYTARATAVVENAELATPAEAQFTVEGEGLGEGAGLGRAAVVYAIIAVVVINALAGLGLWTGQARQKRPRF